VTASDPLPRPVGDCALSGFPGAHHDSCKFSKRQASLRTNAARSLLRPRFQRDACVLVRSQLYSYTWRISRCRRTVVSPTLVLITISPGSARISRSWATPANEGITRSIACAGGKRARTSCLASYAMMDLANATTRPIIKIHTATSTQIHAKSPESCKEGGSSVDWQSAAACASPNSNQMRAVIALSLLRRKGARGVLCRRSSRLERRLPQRNIHEWPRQHPSQGFTRPCSPHRTRPADRTGNSDHIFEIRRSSLTCWV